MRRAYGLLGILFVIVLGGALWALESVEAPTEDVPEKTDYSSNDEQAMLTLTSSVFVDGGMIPSEYTCDGKRYLNPPLLIQNVPEGTESLILVMDDPDISEVFKEERGIDAFDHWVVYNIPPSTREIVEGQNIGTEGLNSAGTAEYTGPCPPPDREPAEHRYVFRLYAISGTLHFIKTPTLAEVETAAEGMVLEKTTLTGRYSRSQ